MFSDIGGFILTHNPKDITDIKECIQYLSQKLVPLYGDFFSPVELEKMVEIKMVFKYVTELSRYSSLFSWGYLKKISSYLNMKSDEHYRKELIGELLSDICLQNKALLLGQKIENHIEQGSLYDYLNDLLKNKIVLREILIDKEKLFFRSDSIRKLLSQAPFFFQPSSTEKSQVHTEVLVKINNRIQSFIAFQNYYLNHQFNVLLFKKIKKENIFKKMSSDLEMKLLKSFNSEYIAYFISLKKISLINCHVTYAIEKKLSLRELKKITGNNIMLSKRTKKNTTKNLRHRNNNSQQYNNNTFIVEKSFSLESESRNYHFFSGNIYDNKDFIHLILTN
jgi:hypothetical protein